MRIKQLIDELTKFYEENGCYNYEIVAIPRKNTVELIRRVEFTNEAVVENGQVTNRVGIYCKKGTFKAER